MFLGVLPSANCQPTDAAPMIPLIKIESCPITTVIETLTRQAGINFIIDPKLFPKGEPKVTFTWTNITAKDALARLLKENGFVLVEDKFTTVAQLTTTNHVPNIVDASLLGSEPTNIISMPNGVVPIVRFRNVTLSDALKNLIESAHINAVLDPKVADYVDPNDHGIFSSFIHNVPMISAHWENITARQATVALCENYDLVIVKDSATGEVRIKPKD